MKFLDDHLRCSIIIPQSYFFSALPHNLDIERENGIEDYNDIAVRVKSKSDPICQVAWHAENFDVKQNVQSST